MEQSFFPHSGTTHRHTWTWALLVLSIAFVFGGQILGLIPLKLLNLVTRETIEQYPQFLYILISVFGMIAVVLTLWIKYYERLPFASAGLSFNQAAFKRFIRGYGFGLLMGSAIVASVYLLGGYVVERDTSLGVSDVLIILSLTVGFIIQSSTEEYLFRGWLMSRLIERHGTLVGIIGNTAVFSLLHFSPENFHDDTLMNILFVTLLPLFSIFLSLYVIRERSIWGACAWHAAWNAVFITWYGLPTTGIAIDIQPLLVDLMPSDTSPMWLHGGPAGPEDSIMSSVVLVTGCLLAWKWRR